jgi:peptidoglycan hydrolase-like protein with peptidoglycan-binding domain
VTPEDIKQIQESLNLLGYNPGRFDGTFDDATRAAVKRFQDATGANGAGTGDLDDLTRWVIGEKGAERRADPVYSDPKYLAFMRMSGVDEANIRNEIQARIDQTNRETNRAAAGFAQRKTDQTRQIGLDFEDRGLFGSGGRMTQQADASAKIDYDRQMEEAARADALANANRSAEQDLAKIAQNRAEEELNARSRVAEKRGAQTYQAGV